MDNVFHQDNQGDRVKKNNPNNEKPLRYYEHLRKRNVPYKTSVGSQVVEVEDGASVIRLVHLAQIMPLTDSNFFIYLDAPGLLALRHFNERSNAVVHNLSELLQGCNIILTMDMLDIQSHCGQFLAVQLLYHPTTNAFSSSTRCHPWRGTLSRIATARCLVGCLRVAPNQSLVYSGESG